MSYRARLIPVEGPEQIVEQAKQFTVEQLQEWVGGYAEHVTTRPPARSMYINQDAIGLGLPLNVTASALIDPRFFVRPPGLRGPVVVILRKGDQP